MGQFAAISTFSNNINRFFTGEDNSLRERIDALNIVDAKEFFQETPNATHREIISLVGEIGANDNDPDGREFIDTVLKAAGLKDGVKSNFKIYSLVAMHAFNNILFALQLTTNRRRLLDLVSL